LVNHESGAVVGWCVTNIDITEQRQALEARERELSLIIETIPAFVWSTSVLAVLLLLATYSGGTEARGRPRTKTR
jgi:hypothetical protein